MPFISLFIALSITSCSFFSKSTTPQQETLIPRSLLFGNPERLRPTISPDGMKIAFLAPDKKHILNVFIQDIQNQHGEPKQCTRDSHRGIRQFFWQKDSQHILYLQDCDGDENWNLYQTDIQTNETRNLTPVQETQISILAYEGNYPDELLIQMNKRDKKVFDVYKLSLSTGSETLVEKNDGNTNIWIADTKLNIRASQEYERDGSTLIKVRSTNDAMWKELARIGPEDMQAEPIGFSDDGNFLYLLSAEKNNTTCLQKIDIRSKETALLACDEKGDIIDVMVNPNTHTVEAACVERDKRHWILLDQSIAPDFNILRTLCHGDTFTISSRDRQNSKWIITSFSDKKPPDFYLYDRRTKHTTFLFNAQPALQKYPLSPMLPISFLARDGMQLYGYLTLPSNGISTPPPMVLFVHGGPWARDSWDFNSSVQWLANRGYAVLQINFRGSTGYGKEYINAGDHEWANKMQTDLLDGKEWAIEHGYADPHKIAIYGGSYGGYATLVGLAFTPNEFCCGVDVVGPSNLVSLIQSIPPYWYPQQYKFNLRVGSIEKNKEELIDRSPLFKARSITKPLLIAQGANDPRVKKQESDQMVEALRQNKQRVEYLLFPDEGHGFSRPSNRLCFFAAMEQFLHEHLGGRYQEPTKDEDWSPFRK